MLFPMPAHRFAFIQVWCFGLTRFSPAMPAQPFTVHLEGESPSVSLPRGVSFLFHTGAKALLKGLLISLQSMRPVGENSSLHVCASAFLSSVHLQKREGWAPGGGVFPGLRGLTLTPCVRHKKTLKTGSQGSLKFPSQQLCQGVWCAESFDCSGGRGFFLCVWLWEWVGIIE